MFLLTINIIFLQNFVYLFIILIIFSNRKMEKRKSKLTKSNNPIKNCPIKWEEPCKWNGRSDKLKDLLLDDHSCIYMRVFIKKSNHKFMMYPNCEASKTFCSKNHLSMIGYHRLIFLIRLSRAPNIAPKSDCEAKRIRQMILSMKLGKKSVPYLVQVLSPFKYESIFERRKKSKNPQNTFFGEFEFQ